MTAPSTMRRFQDHTPPFVACPVPRCGKAIGPSGILCRDHYAIVPLFWRKPRNRALRLGDTKAAAAFARKCVEIVGGPA